MKRLAGLMCSLMLVAACDTGAMPPEDDRSGTPTPVPTETPVSETTGTPSLKDDPAEKLDRRLEAVKQNYAGNWTIGEGWPGEYPNGFSVSAEKVVLMGRSVPDPNIAPDKPCLLETGATYHEWNKVRVKTDNLTFISATEQIPLTVTKDATVKVEQGLDMVPVEVKAGDTILLERYFSEGFGQIGIAGKSYTTDLQQLIDYTDGNQNDPLKVDEWVEITCADKGAHRAWFLYRDVIEAPGIIPTPIEGFGEASDLE